MPRATAGRGDLKVDRRLHATDGPDPGSPVTTGDRRKTKRTRGPVMRPTGVWRIDGEHTPKRGSPPESQDSTGGFEGVAGETYSPTALPLQYHRRAGA